MFYKGHREISHMPARPLNFTYFPKIGHIASISCTVHTGYSAIGYSAKSDIVPILCPQFWSHLLIC